MKRVIAVHGWDGTPEDGWFPWLRQELEARGFVVVIPQLPDAGTPRIETWVPALAADVGAVDDETYFVGHSMGCQTIIRYFESLPEGTKMGGAVFVAGFFEPLTGLETEDERAVDQQWSQTPINTEKVRAHLTRSVAIFSDNDPWVPVSNAEVFKSRLGSEIIVLPNQSHFNGGSGFKELPIALEKLLEIAGTEAR